MLSTLFFMVTFVPGRTARSAVRRVIDVLGSVAAVEQHRPCPSSVTLVPDGVPDRKCVVAGAHEGHVVAIAPVDQVAPLATEDDVVAEAAVQGGLDGAGFERASTVSSPPLCVERQPVESLLEEDVDRGWDPEDVDPSGCAAVPKVSSPWVPFTVTVSAWPSPPPSGPRGLRPFCVTSVPLRSPRRCCRHLPTP